MPKDKLRCYFDPYIEAIEFIKKNEPPEGYFLGFSGGKDSVVLEHLTKVSGVKYQSYYSATGIDPPEVVKFIKQNYPEVIFLRPEKSFYELIVKKGYPTKKFRWCCDALKKIPAKKIELKHRLMGLRAEESFKRRQKPRIDKFQKNIIYKPIFKISEWEIWDYIEINNLKYCNLYDEGFNRIGCVVCPFICGKNQAKLLKHKNKWPKMYLAFERAMSKLFEARVWKDQKIKNSSKEEFIQNWYLGKN